ncbi:MAG: exo-alpha-sialidase [Candidatus Hydrogenedentes bacterium]|nr:exo-alpha-sialidase [Candidatus Hydrogenedentota bacterium]
MLLFLTLLTIPSYLAHAQEAPKYSVELRTVMEHDDREFLWFHPRACAIPGPQPFQLMTIQKHLHLSDFYSGLHTMTSHDGGATWTPPEAQAPLAWRDEGDGAIEAVCDVTPAWHAPSGKAIAIGIKVRYRDGVQVYDKPQSHGAAYAVYDPKSAQWSAWQFVEMPDPAGKFYLTGPGCAQWHVEENGDLLLPFYYRAADTEQFSSTVMRCSFDGKTLRYLEHGTEMTVDVERGLVEPSLTRWQGRYYLTIRNDVKGYVTTSMDGLHYDPIRPWLFDDGGELGSYNTQQHWIAHSGGLFLSYTRRGANNDHVFRNRAPLFMAQVDPKTLRVLRATEKALIPERGATLGNSGVANISPTETWVTVSEGVWDDAIRARGAKGATYIAHILWETPNLLVKE